jgi:hypothetical protein
MVKKGREDCGMAVNMPHNDVQIEVDTARFPLKRREKARR